MKAGLCPSSPAKEGALLIGVIVGGRTAFLQPAVAVTDDDLSQAGERVEERFRFALPCLRSGCHNFGDGRCDLVRRFMTDRSAEAAPSAEHLSGAVDDAPDCPIRSRCEWFTTVGIQACGVCPSVHRPQALR